MPSGKLTLGCARSTDLLLGEFEGYQLGSEPTPRLRNNVTSKLGRIKAFLGYMARGTAEPGDFLFLNQPARIRAWAARLGQTRMAEPTRQHYLKNVAQFLDYLSETPPAACQLSSTALVLIRREVRALIRGIRRRVVVHEVRTKQAKESRLIPKASLVRCHRTAGRKIPALLGKQALPPFQRFPLFVLPGHQQPLVHPATSVRPPPPRMGLIRGGRGADRRGWTNQQPLVARRGAARPLPRGTSSP